VFELRQNPDASGLGPLRNRSSTRGTRRLFLMLVRAIRFSRKEQLDSTLPAGDGPSPPTVSPVTTFKLPLHRWWQRFLVRSRRIRWRTMVQPSCAEEIGRFHRGDRPSLSAAGS